MKLTQITLLEGRGINSLLKYFKSSDELEQNRKSYEVRGAYVLRDKYIAMLTRQPYEHEFDFITVIKFHEKYGGGDGLIIGRSQTNAEWSDELNEKKEIQNFLDNVKIYKKPERVY